MYITYNVINELNKNYFKFIKYNLFKLELKLLKKQINLYEKKLMKIKKDKYIDYQIKLFNDLKLIYSYESDFNNKFINNLKTEYTKNLYNQYINYCNKIKSNIPDNLIINEVICILKSINKQCFIVGGFIRNILIDKNPKDIDFVIDAEYDILKNKFVEFGFNVKECGKDYLVLFVSKSNINIEISNFRQDIYDNEKKIKNIKKSNIFEDVKRRDFTINSLYFNLCNDRIYDLTGNGIIDIENKILRFIGNSTERLKEDYLRAWRFFRFIQLGFKPENSSYKKIKSLWIDIYNNSNAQRVLQELLKF